MRNIALLLCTLGIFLASTKNTVASPTTPNFKNPNVVVFYTSGNHGIVGESSPHSGIDIVMAAGQSGNFQQWFLGTSDTEGYHGEHSVWKVQKNGYCTSGWIEIVNANNNWGSYLQSGNYCVKTNDFSGQH